MACSVEEFQLDVGAITANQAGGFHLDSYKGSFGPRAHIVSVLVDNQSEANLRFITDHTRPYIPAGERKMIQTQPGCREVFLSADTTVTSGQVLTTVSICRGHD